MSFNSIAYKFSTYLKNNWVKTLVASLMLAFSLFLVFNYFSMNRANYRFEDYKKAYEYGDVILTTYNSELTSYEKVKGINANHSKAIENQPVVVSYDLISQTSIESLSEIDGLLAIEPVIHRNDYLYTFEQQTKDINHYFPKTFKSIERSELGFNSMYLKDSELTIEQANEKFKGSKIYLYPNEQPFVGTKRQPVVSKGIFADNESSYQWLNQYGTNTSISTFYLVGDVTTVPLLYGKYPLTNQEVLLDKTSSEMISKLLALNSVEKLINKEINIYVKTEKTSWLTSGQTLANDVLFDCYTYTVSGILDVGNAQYSGVYFNEPIDSTQMIHSYVTNKDNLNFMSLNLIVEPNTNINKIVNRINEVLGCANSRIVPTSNIQTSSYLFK